MSKKTITVERVSPFGVFVDGEWLNMDKKANISSDEFQKGDTYEVEVNEYKGKEYIKKILKNGEAPAPTATVKTSKPVYTKSTGNNDQISKQGCLQAAMLAVAQSGFAPVIDELFPMAEAEAKKMYKSVNSEWS